MVATPTKKPPSDGLKAESLPLIDMRTLTQSELYNLSLCSTPAFDLSHTNDVVIPEIDRNIFSESAASRRQTYSRLRQPNSSTAVARRIRFPGHLRAPVTSSPDDPVMAESKSILAHLKNLMNETETENPPADQSKSPVTATSQVGNGSEVPSGAADMGISGERKRKKQTEVVEKGGELGNSPTHHSQPPSTAITEVDYGNGVPSGEANREIAGLSGEGERKRKRRRKEKPHVVEDSGEIELEILNKNGAVVDLRALENGDEVFAEELKKRTIGLESEEELLGFLGSLEGKWGSSRKRRRIVDSGEFSDTLPAGWKLILALKREQYRPSVYCRRYISPKGQQFVSCKDAALFLQSHFGLDNPSQPSTQTKNGVEEREDGNVPEVAPDSVLPDPTTPSAQPKELSVDGLENLHEVYVRDLFECYECKKDFDVKDEFYKHLIAFHEKTTRMYSLGSSIGKDLIFTSGGHQSKVGHERVQERQRSESEMAVHEKDNTSGSKESPGEAIVQKSSKSPSPDDNQPNISRMDTSVEIAKSSIAKCHTAEPNEKANGGSSSPKELEVVTVPKPPTANLDREAILQKEVSESSLPNAESVDCFHSLISKKVRQMAIDKKGDSQNSKKLIVGATVQESSDSPFRDAFASDKANGGSSSHKKVEVTIPETPAANGDREAILQNEAVESSLPKVESLGCFHSIISKKARQMAMDKKDNSRNSKELIVEATVQKSSDSPYRDDYQPKISTMDAFSSDKANGGLHEEAEVTIPETLAASTDQEAILQDGATESPLSDVESLDCFIGISDKEEHGLYKADQSFSFTNGFEELTATEPVNHNFSFLSGQDSPYLQDSMNLTTMEGMEEGFNSADRSGSDTGKYQFTAVCVWCQSNFNYEAVGLETGSFVGVMCPACKTKISGQFNML